jgi:hypothetical protein
MIYLTRAIASIPEEIETQVLSRASPSANLLALSRASPSADLVGLRHALAATLLPGLLYYSLAHRAAPWPMPPLLCTCRALRRIESACLLQHEPRRLSIARVWYVDKKYRGALVFVPVLAISFIFFKPQIPDQGNSIRSQGQTTASN